MFIGDINEGIEFYKKNKDKAKAMVEAGQKYVIEKYNHKEIFNQWKNALQV